MPLRREDRGRNTACLAGELLVIDAVSLSYYIVQLIDEAGALYYGIGAKRR